MKGPDLSLLWVPCHTGNALLLYAEETPKFFPQLLKRYGSVVFDARVNCLPFIALLLRLP